MNHILTTTNKKEDSFLRKKTVPFDFSKYTGKELRDLIASMRKMMRMADGIGLSANQIGLNVQMFIAEIPDSAGKPKFYAIFNPKIEKISKDQKDADEGCLSIPGIYGEVPRAYRLTLSGQDKNGKNIKIKATGLLARIFQHECDHLNGALFVDRVQKDTIRSSS